MKRLTFVMIFLMLGLGGMGLAFADEDMGVFANLNTNSIQFIDPVTNTATEPLLVDDIAQNGFRFTGCGDYP